MEDMEKCTEVLCRFCERKLEDNLDIKCRNLPNFHFGTISLLRCYGNDNDADQSLTAISQLDGVWWSVKGKSHWSPFPYIYLQGDFRALHSVEKIQRWARFTNFRRKKGNEGERDVREVYCE